MMNSIDEYMVIDDPDHVLAHILSLLDQISSRLTAIEGRLTTLETRPSSQDPQPPPTPATPAPPLNPTSQPKQEQRSEDQKDGVTVAVDEQVTLFKECNMKIIDEKQHYDMMKTIDDHEPPPPLTPPPYDVISHLPDHVLAHILFLLTSKEGARTRILSKRWRYLWTPYPNLDFDASKTLDELEYKRHRYLSLYDDDSVFLIELMNKLKKTLDVERQRYLSWVDQVITSHRGPNIDQFKVQFGLGHHYASIIDEWLVFAFRMNVRRLALKFEDFSNPCQLLYSFPDITTLQGIISKSLTSLELDYVNITGEVVQFVLSTCPLLECLVVCQSPTLVNLEVNSISLKYLKVGSCSKLTNFMITAAPNLVSFTYSGGGHKKPMELTNFPKLTDMWLESDVCEDFVANPLEFSSYLSQLQVLILEFNLMEEVAVAAEFPVFARLKRLELKIICWEKSLVSFAASMLKACPSLSEISYTNYDCQSGESLFQPEVAICPRESLKVVELVGFVSLPTVVELALFLMNSALNLEKIIFDTRKSTDVGTVWEGAEEDKREEIQEKRAGRRRARKLVKKLRPGVTSVII